MTVLMLGLALQFKILSFLAQCLFFPLEWRMEINYGSMSEKRSPTKIFVYFRVVRHCADNFLVETPRGNLLLLSNPN